MVSAYLFLNAAGSGAGFLRPDSVLTVKKVFIMYSLLFLLRQTDKIPGLIFRRAFFTVDYYTVHLLIFCERKLNIL